MGLLNYCGIVNLHLVPQILGRCYKLLVQGVVLVDVMLLFGVKGNDQGIRIGAVNNRPIGVSRRANMAGPNSRNGFNKFGKGIHEFCASLITVGFLQPEKYNMYKWSWVFHGLFLIRLVMNKILTPAEAWLSHFMGQILEPIGLRRIGRSKHR